MHPIYRSLRMKAICAAAAAMITGVAPVQASSIFVPGNLVVSRSTYEGTASTVTVGQSLPGGGTATNNGIYPGVFLNAAVDGSFGVTSPIFLDQISKTGAPVLLNGSATNTFAVPTSVVTSFPSKSELSLNLTPNGQGVTFMGYATGINQLDISNSTTPGIPDSGNPDKAPPTQRVVAQVNADGSLQTTTTNAYTGNNGRAALLAPNGYYYAVGNAGNGGSATPVTSTGVQLITPGQNAPLNAPGTFQVGSYSVTQNGYPPDKPIKDNNYRGETVFNNTLYVSKGSGSNGINTVYQVGAPGSLALPPGPEDSAPITILPGFPTNLANGPANTVNHPFGLWFANANTLYVADEGDGALADAAGSTSAGLEKWSFSNGTWVEDYVLQNGLNLGVNYTVTDPNNPANSYTAATDGLRDLTGQINADGTVTLFAITSTVSNQLVTGDQGADPNKLVSITDRLGFLTSAQAAGETFTTIDSAAYGNVLRGVAFAPTAVPEPSTWAMSAGAMILFIGFALRTHKRQPVD